MQDCFCTETPVFCSASKQKGTRKISRPKAAGRNDEPLAVFQGNEQIIGILAVQCIGLALNEIDLVHRQGKLTSHKSVDGVLLGVRLQAGHDRKLLGVQSLLDIFTDHGSREPEQPVNRAAPATAAADRPAIFIKLRRERFIMRPSL